MNTFESHVIDTLVEVTPNRKNAITSKTLISELGLGDLEEGRVVSALEGSVGISDAEESDLLVGDPTVEEVANRLRQKFSGSVTVGQ